MRSPIVLAAAASACWSIGAAAQAGAPTDGGATVTFYRDVLPILQDNCQECHRREGANYGGMRAPMAFTSYEDTRPWAKSIAQQVVAREMPPWDAHPRHNGQFKNERVLSDGQIDTLVRWAALGAPAGDLTTAPPERSWQVEGGWLIGTPDLVVPMPEPYFVADDVQDLYAAFSVDLSAADLPEDRWVVAFQCSPDSSIIHHFNLHLLEPHDGKLPEQLPEFPKNDELAPQNAGRYMGGTASGSDANRYPEGYGFLLKRGSRVTFDIHYHKPPGAGTGVWDRSTIGFKFAPGPLRRLGSGLRPLMRFDFAIPAGAPNYQIGPLHTVATADADLISLMPHKHMRGKAAKYEAFYPDGTSEILLEVPHYDFSWQIVYYLKEPKRIPQGTRLEYTAWYDNSPEKAARYGFNSAEEVRFGQPSTAEMVMGFLMAAPTVAGTGEVEAVPIH